MRTGTIQVTALGGEGRRLTAGFHLSEDQQAVRQLNAFPATVALATLCTGRGVFRGGIFRKIEAASADHGRPYASPKDLEQLWFQPSSYLSELHGPLLDELELREGMILVTCSGMNLGTAIWTRPDQAGLCASGDLIRVIADDQKVPPGYLYAFLGGRFGRAAIRKQIYGGNIKHVDPSHIERISVPRLRDDVEREIHAAVVRAGQLRSEATALLEEVGGEFDALVNEPESVRKGLRVSIATARGLQKRMEAHFHDESVQRIRDAIAEESCTTLGEFCSTIFLPGIFKRIHVSDPNYGALYYTGSALFRADPRPKGVLSPRTSLFEDVQMTQGEILIQAFGQEGGLTGRAVWIGRHLHESTTTHMLARLRTPSRERSAYLFGFLQSQAAYRQIIALRYGGSIPHFDEAGLATVVMPLLDDAQRRSVSERVLRAVEMRDEALDLDRGGKRRVEQAIKEAS